MNFFAKINDTLDKKLPEKTYSDGEKATCIFYRLACVLDPQD